MVKKSNATKIREFMERYPEIKPAAVAERFNVNVQYVYVLRSQAKKQAKANTFVTPVVTMPVVDTQEMAEVSAEKLKSLADAIKELDAWTEDTQKELDKKEADMVNHPPHYTAGGMETINFIEAKGLDYHLGNVVKYITRAGKKADEMEDLKKARWYLERAIAVREGSIFTSN